MQNRKKFSNHLLCIFLIFFTSCSSYVKNSTTNDSSAAKEYLRLHNMWSEGKQAEAEQLVDQLVKKYPDDLQLLFFKAACARSRFAIKRAHEIFHSIVQMYPESVQGRCAVLVMGMDSEKDVDKNFEALRKLADANPDNLMLKWMLAVQCRTHKKNKEGIQHFEEIIRQVSIAPVMVHHTYANLLEEAGLYNKALVHRKAAVEMEDKSWIYHGMANTYYKFNKYSQAEEFYQIAVEKEPGNHKFLTDWGCSLYALKQYEQAIKKCKKATEIDINYCPAWDLWGMSLAVMGFEKDAVEKLEMAITLCPFNSTYYSKCYV